MIFAEALIQKWARVTARNPDGFLLAAVSLFFFCSLGYALLLAMTLAALTHQVLASFNIAAGVLLGAFGCGVSRRPEAGEAAVPALLKSLLIFMGAGALTAFYLKVTDFARLNLFVHVSAVGLLILLFGYLSGQGLGLFRAVLSSRDQRFLGRMLMAGAGGLFLGALCFAVLFYTRLGVVTSLFSVAWLSSLAALFLVSQFPSLPSGQRSSDAPVIFAHACAAVILPFLMVSPFGG